MLVLACGRSAVAPEAAAAGAALAPVAGRGLDATAAGGVAEAAEAGTAAAEAAGVTIKSVHWTTGAYDLVIVAEGSEQALMSVALKTATLGNVRTQTMRAFSLDEMKALVAGIG